MGLAAGLGVGEGLGVRLDGGLGEGLGDALTAAEGDGLSREAVAELEQPAMASVEMTANSLIPTGSCNARTRADVTPRIACTPFTISPLVSGLN